MTLYHGNSVILRTLVGRTTVRLLRVKVKRGQEAVNLRNWVIFHTLWPSILNLKIKNKIFCLLAECVVGWTGFLGDMLGSGLSRYT